MKALFYLVLLILSGCVSTGTLPDVPKETLIPVGKPCLTQDQVPTKPDFVTDTQLAKMNDEQFVLDLATDRLLRMDYEEKLEARLAGCVGSKPVPGVTQTPRETPAPKRWWEFWK